MADPGVLEATQYLSFMLDQEVFAVDVARVREILEYKGTTRIPQTPAYLRGVINLRGSVVPVVDLRLLFGMPAVEHTINTCVIVLEINVEGDTVVAGALADSVREVLELEATEVEAAPRLGSRLNTDFIKGMGKRNEQFLMLLDIDRVFGDETIGVIRQTGGTAAEADETA
ncbi:chemotaxis protein CheW [Trichlorobacter ammonificans]|uniref:Positive regulator of CheA protein activity (CheW) n=1 Tax=Trichlorobacter ammonificans TaxID=2916410 RepID=A0ABM9DA10_9BACT|nr:chemotaxis protein CheW [Trichlorobacter ammonificans]CAH2031238.1 Positive regulator of CheA protein activity (CheW) [Trichlorobacter ammonificans]